MSEPIVLSESLGGNSLSKAARAGQLPQWFVPLPASQSEWQQHARRVIDTVSPEWLSALEPAIVPNGAAAATAEECGRKGPRRDDWPTAWLVRRPVNDLRQSTQRTRAR